MRCDGMRWDGMGWMGGDGCKSMDGQLLDEYPSYSFILSISLLRGTRVRLN